jgi:hypothetical protein
MSAYVPHSLDEAGAWISITPNIDQHRNGIILASVGDIGQMGLPGEAEFFLVDAQERIEKVLYLSIAGL